MEDVPLLRGEILRTNPHLSDHQQGESGGVGRVRLSYRVVELAHVGSSLDLVRNSQLV